MAKESLLWSKQPLRYWPFFPTRWCFVLRGRPRLSVQGKDWGGGLVEEFHPPFRNSNTEAQGTFVDVG